MIVRTVYSYEHIFARKKKGERSGCFCKVIHVFDILRKGTCKTVCYTMNTMTDLEQAKEFFIKDRYAMVTTGIDIVEVGERYAKCSLKIDERHINATGHVMGGAIFTLADFVFAVTTNFKQPTTVTTVSQISYLGTPKGDILYGESKLLKDGRRNCFYEIDITDDLGSLVAIVSTSGVHLS